MASPIVTRREALVGAAALTTALAFPARGATAGQPFSWSTLQAQAAQLAARTYAPPPPPPAGVSAVTYDALNSIAFRPEATVWADSAVPIRFFPLNRYAHTPVGISLVEGGRARAFDFRRDLFSGDEHLPADVAGFSGFRLMSPGGKSDWLAFQGASYFRSSGALDQYGLSARGLAIDTGLGRPEEFPNFRHFWLERGLGDAITVYALLDSPSAVGAWRFVNRRGPQGVTQDVSLAVTLRRDVERLGIAPLTSMFWYGEGSREKAIDWRPEIHDSDGLAMLTGAGERIWRPLDNPPHPITNSFSDKDPKGFGLLQRDRNFDHYQDDGVFYEKRPSLWVEPRGAWGAGAVTLFELPTRGETDDNIVAFWTPAAPAKAGNHYALDYTLRWVGDQPGPAAVARTVDCWRGVAGRPGTEPIPDATRLVADFTGPSLAGLDRSSGVEPVVSLSGAKPISIAAYPVVGIPNRWRLIIDVPHKSGETKDLRAYLRRGDTALTETLLYQFL
jgi:glucans biosynthesis protein